jgi:hypothetical protein
MSDNDKCIEFLIKLLSTNVETNYLLDANTINVDSPMLYYFNANRNIFMDKNWVEKEMSDSCDTDGSNKNTTYDFFEQGDSQIGFILKFRHESTCTQNGDFSIHTCNNIHVIKLELFSIEESPDSI